MVVSRKNRLRRVAILCASFVRNLAYYRAGQCEDVRHLLSKYHRSASFWRQANSNFLDICVLDWCKLFADSKEKHHWSNIVSDRAAFEEKLLKEYKISKEHLEEQIEIMRRYRDKFVAHLDSDMTMNIPELDTAKSCVWFYLRYIIDFEAETNDLSVRL